MSSATTFIELLREQVTQYLGRTDAQAVTLRLRSGEKLRCNIMSAHGEPIHTIAIAVPHITRQSGNDKSYAYDNDEWIDIYEIGGIRWEDSAT